MFDCLNKFLEKDFDVENYAINFDILEDSLSNGFSLVIFGDKEAREKMLSVVSRDLIRDKEVVVLIGDHLNFYLDSKLGHVTKLHPDDLSMKLLDLFDEYSRVTLICENLMDNKVKTFLHGISEYIRSFNVRVVGTWGMDSSGDDTKIVPMPLSFDDLQYVHATVLRDRIEAIYCANSGGNTVELRNIRKVGV